MKRIFAAIIGLLLIVASVFLLISCLGGDDTLEPGQGKVTSTSSEGTQAPPPSTAPASEAGSGAGGGGGSAQPDSGGDDEDLFGDE